MPEPNETKPIKPELPPLVPELDVYRDRPASYFLVIFVLACLHRMSLDDTSVQKPEIGWLEQWADAEYLYLETRVDDDASGLELDLNVSGGLMFARIARRSG